MKLPDERDVQVGDVALYVGSGPLGYLHAGLVCEVRSGAGLDISAPWILSKWNDCSGEVVHASHDVPYADQRIEYLLEYWTDRNS